jgi:hypothetical protein
MSRCNVINVLSLSPPSMCSSPRRVPDLIYPEAYHVCTFFLCMFIPYNIGMSYGVHTLDACAHTGCPQHAASTHARTRTPSMRSLNAHTHAERLDVCVHIECLNTNIHPGHLNAYRHTDRCIRACITFRRVHTSGKPEITFSLLFVLFMLNLT